MMAFWTGAEVISKEIKAVCFMPTRVWVAKVHVILKIMRYNARHD